jgi:hypothetical protein
MLEQIILRDHENSENILKRTNPNALSAAQRYKGAQPKQYAPDAIRGCMENTFLNIGVNCKTCVCTVLRNVM